MKFLHLSDTHIRMNYTTNSLTNELFNEYNNPTIHLANLLKQIKEEEYEFAIITGDLVHEGSIEDYELFKQLWQEIVPEIPYYFCRGNHDRQHSFFEGMDVYRSEEGDYLSYQMKDGLRIISLDSAQEEHHEGKISIAQMNILTEWLKKSAPKGTILLQHHPLAWEEPGIATEVPIGFEDVIRQSDVIGIFVGHIHQGTTMPYAGKMQYMAEAISFGVDEYPDRSIFTNRNGYNSCSLTDQGLFVYHHYICPEQTVIGKLAKPFEGNF